MGLLIAAACVSVAGCDTAEDDSAQTESFTLTFAAAVNGAPFSCAQTFTGVGTTSLDAQFSDLKMYVHDVRLVSADGKETALALTADNAWQTEHVALLDFEDATGTCINGNADTRTTIQGTAPAGEYTGVKFKVGVPFAQNHADPATAKAPLTSTVMQWGWQAGYKFLRMDTATFSIHLGSTGCEGEVGAITGCARENRPEIALEGAPSTSVITFDVGALLGGSDLTLSHAGHDDHSAHGCMSGADDTRCAPVFERLGLDLASGQPAGPQSAFSIKAAQ